MVVTLTAHERRLRDLARKHGTPLMLISRSVLRDQLDRFRRALPRVEPFFAIKANSHPEIIKTMVAGRASFDVASVAEMNQVLAAGAQARADHLRQHGQAGRVDRARRPRRA